MMLRGREELVVGSVAGCGVPSITRSKLCGAIDRSRWRTPKENRTAHSSGFSGGLFATFLALAMFEPDEGTAQEVKQIKLTEKHIEGFIAAHEEMAKLYNAADPDEPD